MTSYDAAILIGRFEPFHSGHLGLLRGALATAPRVIVIIGSSFQARSIRNPFSAAERMELIRVSLPALEAERITFLPMRDYWNTDHWAKAVTESVSRIAPGARTALIGFRKDDDTGDYLDHFSNWGYVGLPRQGEIDATLIRESILRDGTLEPVAHFLPPAVFAWLSSWSHTPACARLRKEWRALEAEHARHGDDLFQAVDTLVRSDRSVLLVRRGIYPGFGLWAFPGTLLESPADDMLAIARAGVRRETGVSLDGIAPGKVELFNHPARSLRGHIETHVHLFHLSGEPPAAPGTGLLEARWIPLESLPRLEEEFFEDHYHITDKMLHAGIRSTGGRSRPIS